MSASPVIGVITVVQKLLHYRRSYHGRFIGPDYMVCTFFRRHISGFVGRVPPSAYRSLRVLIECGLPTAVNSELVMMFKNTLLLFYGRFEGVTVFSLGFLKVCEYAIIKVW